MLYKNLILTLQEHSIDMTHITFTGTSYPHIERCYLFFALQTSKEIKTLGCSASQHSTLSYKKM